MIEARATAAASATWKVYGSTVQLYWRATSLPGGTNQFRYQVDGGSFTTVTQTGPAEPGTTTITGLSTAEHTVRVEWVAGTVAVNGVRGTYPAAQGILVDRFAMHGAAAVDMAPGGAARRVMAINATSGQAQITAATGGYFTAADVGARITGAPFGTFGAYIGSVTNATTASIVNAEGAAATATANGTAASCVIENLPNTNLQGATGIMGWTFGNAFAPGVGNNADVVVIALGANDAAAGNRATVEAYRDQLGRMVAAYLSTSDGVTDLPDFVFVANHIGRWFNIEGRYAQFVAQQYALATAVSGVVVDAWQGGRRSYQYAQDQRYWAGVAGDNAVHLSRSGQQWLGQAVLDQLAA